MYGVSWRGLALLGFVRPCPARLCNVGLGVLWYRTVRSCPAWRCSAWQGFIEVWYGLALFCPVLLGIARCGVSRHGVELWGGVLSGWVKSSLALQCKVRHFVAVQCPVRLGIVKLGQAG